MILPVGTTVNTSSATEMAALSQPSAPFGNSSRPIVQNLGPGTLWLGTSVTSVETYGLKLPVNAVYELPATLVEGAGQIYLKATVDNCDVRIINVG
jgi:hypothetical protein